MDEGLANVDKKADESNQMPDMSPLTNVASSFHRMGLSQKSRQVNLLAAKLGLQPQQRDEDLSPADLSTTMIKRALAAGKTQQEIDEALKE